MREKTKRFKIKLFSTTGEWHCDNINVSAIHGRHLH